MPANSYRVLLDPDGGINWETVTDGQVVRYRDEPGTGFRRRFLADLLKLLPIGLAALTPVLSELAPAKVSHNGGPCACNRVITKRERAMSRSIVTKILAAAAIISLFAAHTATAQQTQNPNCTTHFVYFTTGSYALTSEDQDHIRDVATMMQRTPVSS